MKRLGSFEMQEEIYSWVIKNSNKCLTCDVNSNMNGVFVIIGINRKTVFDLFNKGANELVDIDTFVRIQDFSPKLEQAIATIASDYGYELVEDELSNNQVIFVLQQGGLNETID